MTANRNVLLVSYHYPPLGGSGVQRAVKLARYLPQAGWGVHVLTAGHRHYPLLDPSLSAEPSEGADGPLTHDGVRVHRVLGFEPGGIAASATRWLRRFEGPRRGATAARRPPRASLEDHLYWRLQSWCDHLRIPEAEVLWVRAAVRAARRIIQEHNIDVVLTTSPPHSIQRVGLALHRRTGLPWIADLRDPILDNFDYQPASPRADRYWRRLERDVVTNAARVVVTCPDLIEPLRRRYPDVSASKFVTITNGYDPADLPMDHPRSNIRRPTGRFVLGYVGSFYGRQTIEPILTAMRRLISVRPDIAGRIELRVVGSISARLRELLHNTDDAFLRLVGYRPHAESLEQMAAADALFLMTPANEGGRLCIPAKAFEYLAFGEHVIALVHERSTTSRILRKAGNVTLVSHGDSSQLVRAIEQSYEAWLRGAMPSPRCREAVEQHRRDRLARHYAEVLENCLSVAQEAEPMAEPCAAWGAA